MPIQAFFLFSYLFNYFRIFFKEKPLASHASLSSTILILPEDLMTVHLTAPSFEKSYQITIVLFTTMITVGTKLLKIL